MWPYSTPERAIGGYTRDVAKLTTTEWSFCRLATASRGSGPRSRPGWPGRRLRAPRGTTSRVRRQLVLLCRVCTPVEKVKMCLILCYPSSGNVCEHVYKCYTAWLSWDGYGLLFTMLVIRSGVVIPQALYYYLLLFIFNYYLRSIISIDMMNHYCLWPLQSTNGEDETVWVP